MYSFTESVYNVFTERYDDVLVTIAVSEVGTVEDANALAIKEGWIYKRII